MQKPSSSEWYAGYDENGDYESKMRSSIDKEMDPKVAKIITKLVKELVYKIKAMGC